MLAGWTRTAIAGKPADVFAPPDALPQTVLYLHSLHAETPAADPVLTAALTAHRLRCVAPFGGQCWWADRVCAEFDPDVTPERFVLESVVPWAEAEWQLGPRALALAGVEMGGQGALRIAFKHPDRFPVAASLSGALDCQDWYGLGSPLDGMYDSRERCRLDTTVLHVHERHWPARLWFCCAPDDGACYLGNDRLREKLRAMGVPHTADLDTKPPAGETYADHMAPRMLAFVADALRREANRLV
ncbi:MAG: hypothetical protein K2V38_26340 [Gemmataceae bacterium]|nr:hypothetical protein [Gemmataceae bacterium]